ncbi:MULTISPECIES: hypothetical protein [Pseudomonas]|uniref:hypothetical protein n=1 Tax=Pseudomonas TaxID=286 RepID=UPI00117ACAC1|nr:MULTISPECIES: hypothetical protein [Pseudomonas]UNK65725.1 hypothetical protein MNO08_23990 [Pseudomonas simiae]
MAVNITKIQFLAHRDSGHPIFYCHAHDLGHAPMLEVTTNGNSIFIEGQDLLFKVKKNPQTKNRIDIYMPIESANALGRELAAATQGCVATPWRQSTASPGQFASGRMALPEIVWSKFGKTVEAIVGVDSGTQMSKLDAYVNIDLETPHDTHIMMRSAEIHIGVTLDNPSGVHDSTRTTLVNVPEAELQRGTGESNPIPKVSGYFSLEFSKQVAAGLGQLLIGTVAPIAAR